ncbi:phage tail tape measure protein [Streptomyces sp. NPDC056049]|uniref:phage tail tape measure protein n=1 Tax=Streptomyces sp. NPDC056049 TaxID=3345693 RepID=UPI0035D6018B
MALTVGELNAVLSVDDRTVAPTLRRAEQAMRQSGQRMGQDAQDAGEDVGQQLGEGVRNGLVSRIRASLARFRSAGEAAGDAVGEGLADAATEGTDAAVEQAGGRFDRLKMLGAGAGVAAGAALAAGFQEALNQGQITSRLGAQLGATGPEAAKYGKIAGQLFKDAVVTDFQQGADTIRAIAGSGLLPPGATNEQIKSIATNAADLANTFEVDLPMAANAAGAMVKNGLAKNSKEAFDLLTAGMTGLGPAADDLLETFGEYSPVFKSAGLSGETALGLMRQAIQGGWVKDTDKIADAFKELNLRATEGSKGVQDAFKALGLDAKKTGDDIAAGGKRGEKGMDLVLEKLRELGPNTQEAKQIVSTLFGGPGEDMGAALFALDVDKAADSLGNVSGEADKLGDKLRDNASSNLTSFKNTVQQNLVEFLGNDVIPAVTQAFSFVAEHSTEFKVAALAITGVLVPALGLLAVTATVKMGVVVWAWMTSGAASLKAAAVHVGSALTTAGAWVMMALRATGAFLATAASATANALKTAAAWAMAGVRMTVTFLAAVLRVTAVTLAQFALMAARAVAWAATMAAQWLIAMGPIGWIILAVGALVTAVIVYWDEIKAATKQAWDWIVRTATGLALGLLKWFMSWPIWSAISKKWQEVKAGTKAMWDGLMAWLRALPGRIVGFFGGWQIAATISRHWQNAKRGAIEQATALLSWMRKLPGEILRSLGQLGNLLLSAGRDVVRGLWEGIQRMGGWIKSKILGWARTVIPGPIARALGIASPSKVTAKQGEWIARGLVVGMTSGLGQIRATAQKMANIIIDATTVALTPKKKGGTKKQNRAIEEANRRLLESANKMRSKAMGILNKASSQLQQLARQEERVASKLKAATKRLDDLVKARADLVASVRSGILDSANITRDTENGVTGASILANLQDDLKRAKQFAADLEKLRKKGVRADLISQIAQAGVEQGGATAAALAAASSGQIKQINDTQKQLVSAADKAGRAAGDAMYGAGIQAARGLVDGLKREQAAIEKQMLQIATAMEKAIKRALGIKSPSRVMAAIGRFIPAGLVRGIDAGQSAVDASMSNLVKPPTPPTASAGAYAGAGPVGSGGSGGGVTVMFKSSGTPRGDYLVQEMRAAVKRGGGDVQIVLGQRR